jgi:hypothetical protein
MNDPDRLRVMAAHAAALGKPHAISDILKVLEKFVSNEKVSHFTPQAGTHD